MSNKMIAISIAIAAGIIGFASYYWLGPDNKIEEECEKVIKDETGMVVDLSPGSNSTPSQSSTSTTSGSTSSPSTSL